MRVALVTPYSWTTPGGVNAHVGALAEHLRARGHEVRVLAPADGPTTGIVRLGRTVPVPYNGSVARLAFGPRVLARIRVALRRAPPDLVHVHEPFAPSASMLAVIAARAPVVATFHHAGDGRVYRAVRAPLTPLWRKLAVRIAVSAAAQASVAHVFRSPAARIIPNGVDVAAYADVPPADPASARVLFFGRLERRKGAGVLVAALPRLFELMPEATVRFAGDGPLRAELQAAVPSAHRDAVAFTGRFAEEERGSMLEAAAVVCLPALGGESFGYTVVEAMAAGRPVVASAIAGYAGVMRDGTDGVLVPPDDPRALAEALAALLRDPARARVMGEAARAYAARYDWPVVTDAIEEAYAAALASGAGRAR